MSDPTPIADDAHASTPTRAGIVTVAGKPNAGKSTLLNRLVGEHLAITSPKPQATRHRIVGIRSDNGVQMVVLDTPGLLAPQHSLHEAMRGTARAALRDADVILHLIDATDRPPHPRLHEIAELDAPPRAPVLRVFNQIDRLDDATLAALREREPDAVFVSALQSTGLDALVTRITDALPLSPYLYPEDELSTQPMRFFVAEFVREVALEQLGDEVPHALAVGIEEYREGSSPLYIRAVLHVERDSQKRIVIGEGGQRIKAIGRAARERIEAFVGSSVYLDLWVKVLPNWRRRRASVTRLGFGDPDAPGTAR